MKKMNSFHMCLSFGTLAVAVSLAAGCGKPSTPPPAEGSATAGVGEAQVQPLAKAKPLSISEWIKGATAQTPVDVTDGKNIYVVEFWATWCGPCKTSIPHLSELQAQYKEKGVVIVGISKETAEEVKPFVEEQGEKMDYIVALDKENQTHQDYMRAYGQNGIPCAFIINRAGQVAWVGHPFEIDGPLKEMVEGTYDLDAFQKADAPRAQVAEYKKLVEGKDPQAGEQGRAALEAIGTDMKLIQEMLAASYEAKDMDLVDKVLTRMESVGKEEALLAEQIRASLKQQSEQKQGGEATPAAAPAPEPSAPAPAQ